MRLPSAAVTVVSLAAVATAVLLLAAPASAQDVIANDDGAEAGRFWLRTNIWQGQLFTPFYDVTVTAVTLTFGDSADGSGSPTNLQAFIYDGDSNEPDSQQATFDCSSAVLPTVEGAAEEVTCTLAAGYEVSATDPCWIVFGSTDSSDNRGEISYSHGVAAPDNPGSRGTLGRVKISETQGSTWRDPTSNTNEPRLRLKIAVDLEPHDSIANDDSTAGTSRNLRDNRGWAQPFVPSTSGSVLAVTFDYESSGFSNAATVELYDTTSGEPGTSLGAFTCPASFVSGDVTTVAPVTCGLGPGVDITPGQTYWIVFLTSDPSHGSLPFSTEGAANTGSPGTFATSSRTPDQGSTWEPRSSGRQLLLDISFAPVTPVLHLGAPTASAGDASWSSIEGTAPTGRSTSGAATVPALTLEAYGIDAYAFGAEASGDGCTAATGACFRVGGTDLNTSPVSRSMAINFITGDDVITRQHVYEEGGSSKHIGIYVEDSDVVFTVETSGGEIVHRFVGDAVANTAYFAGFTLDSAGDGVSFFLNDDEATAVSAAAFGSGGDWGGLGCAFSLYQVESSASGVLENGGTASTPESFLSGYIYNLVVYDAVVPKADLEAVLGRVPDPTPPTPINCGTLESCDFNTVFRYGLVDASLPASGHWCDACDTAAHALLSEDTVPTTLTQDPLSVHGGSYFAYSFTGAGDDICFVAPSSDATNSDSSGYAAKSFFIQFQANDVDPAQTVFSQTDGSAGWDVTIASGDITLTFDYAGGSEALVVPASADALYTIGFVFDGTAGTITFYFQAFAETRSLASTNPLPRHYAPIGIGCNPCSGNYFDGKIVGLLETNSAPSDPRDLLALLPRDIVGVDDTCDAAIVFSYPAPGAGTDHHYWPDACHPELDAIEKDGDLVSLVDVVVFGDTYKAFVFGTGDCFSPPVVDATSDDAEYPLKTVYAQFVTGSDVNTLQVVFEEGGADDGLAIYVENGELVVIVYTDELVVADDIVEFATVPAEADTFYTAGVVFDSVTGVISFEVNNVIVRQVGVSETIARHENPIGIGCIHSGTDLPVLGEVSGADQAYFGGKILAVVAANAGHDKREVVLSQFAIGSLEMTYTSPQAVDVGAGDSSVDVFVSDFRQVTGIALVEAGLPCSDDSALAIATSMSAVSASFTLDSDLFECPTVYEWCLNGAPTGHFLAVLLPTSPSPSVWFHPSSVALDVFGAVSGWTDLMGNSNANVDYTGPEGATWVYDGNLPSQLRGPSKTITSAIGIVGINTFCTGEDVAQGMAVIELFCFEDVADIGASFILEVETSGGAFATLSFPATTACERGQTVFVVDNVADFEDYYGFDVGGTLGDDTWVFVETQGDTAWGGADRVEENGESILRLWSKGAQTETDLVVDMAGPLPNNNYNCGWVRRVNGARPRASIDPAAWQVATDANVGGAGKSSNVQSPATYPIGTYTDIGVAQSWLVDDGPKDSCLVVDLSDLDSFEVSGRTYAVAFSHPADNTGCGTVLAESLDSSVTNLVLDICPGKVTIDVDGLSDELSLDFHPGTAHVAVVSVTAAGDANVYLDGDLAISLSSAGTVAADDSALHIGCPLPAAYSAGSGSARAFAGALFEVMVFGEALSDGDLAMVHAYFLDRYFTGFKLAYASPAVVPDDGTTTDTLLGIFAAGISAPNVESATFSVQAVLSADDSCSPDALIMSTVVDLDDTLEFDFVAPPARPRPYHVCIRSQQSNTAWGATDITYFSQRSAGTGDAGVKHLYLDGATSAIGGGGGGGGGSGDVCTWRQAFVVAPFHSNLDADLLSF